MPQNTVSVHRTRFFLMSLENWANVLNLAFRSNYCSLHAFWHILCLKGKKLAKIAILVRNFCFGKCIGTFPRRHKCHIIHYFSPFLLYASRFSLFCCYICNRESYWFWWKYCILHVFWHILCCKGEKPAKSAFLVIIIDHWKCLETWWKTVKW